MTISHEIKIGDIYNGDIIDEICGQNILWTDAKGQRHMNEAYLVVAERIVSACPAITGSEKQVAWAEGIRAEAARTVAKYAMSRIAETGETERNLNGLSTLADKIAAKTEAGWWIDHRNAAADARTLGPALLG